MNKWIADIVDYNKQSRQFTIYTDRKSLIKTLVSKSKRGSRQTRQSEDISQFTDDIQDVRGNTIISWFPSLTRNIFHIREYCMIYSRSQNINANRIIL
uniref:Uncharacterized protein n=1 Tax=Glossina palpalis gambiensis TaxID=67801 RepID=A0A1B0AKD9_9MUSC